MGAPFEGSWDAVAASAYYAGAGWELIWLILSIITCLAAIWVGHKHESGVNSE